MTKLTRPDEGQREKPVDGCLELYRATKLTRTKRKVNRWMPSLMKTMDCGWTATEATGPRHLLVDNDLESEPELRTHIQKAQRNNLLVKHYYFIQTDGGNRCARALI